MADDGGLVEIHLDPGADDNVSPMEEVSPLQALSPDGGGVAEWPGQPGVQTAPPQQPQLPFQVPTQPLQQAPLQAPVWPAPQPVQPVQPPVAPVQPAPVQAPELTQIVPGQVPEKFQVKDAAGNIDLQASLDKALQSYGQLEQRLGQPQPQPQVAPQGERRDITPQDFAPIAQEFLQYGKLTPQSYQKMHQEFGQPQWVVDDYLNNWSQNYSNGIASAIGGVDNLNKMNEWARNALDANQKLAYNQAVHSGVPQTAAGAAQSLFQMFTSAMGGQVQGQIQGRPEAGGGVEGFKSWKGTDEEPGMSDALMKKDKRGRRLYGKDKRYTQEVNLRIAATHPNVAQGGQG